MINAIIVGISGKMGSLIYQKAPNYGIDIVCGIDLKTVTNVDCPVYKSFDQVKENIDLIIDFSTPRALKDEINFIEKNPCPLFTGVTGYSELENNQIEKLSLKIPIFKTSNTSLGIALMKNIVTFLSKNLSDYEAYIIEKHRKNKKDSPSGTSLAIKNCFLKNQNKVNIFSMRGGDIFGEHEVFFICENEVLSVKHSATSRNLFAEGALKAVLFLLTKKSGLYDMTDYLQNGSD